MSAMSRLKSYVLLVALAVLLGCTQKESFGGRLYRVTDVIDGDTIEIEGGEKVRYIGIDTPERMRHQNNRWVYRPMPFAEEAKSFNKKMVLGKAVRLEMDVVPRDRYGRILAYVFLENTLINEALLRHGYARLLTIPPNVKYVERFRQALNEAKEEKRGLWAE